MTPTVDAFHALARSSPWRWMSLHFRHRSEFPGPCEAWVRRPGELLVRSPDGREERASGLPYTTSLRVAAVSDPDPTPPPLPQPVLPHEATPAYRPDGLVAERPAAHFEVDYDDPMYGNYSWVAMLDPVELADGVALTDLREDVVADRPVWRAEVRALEGYEPRCSCCALIWSEVSDTLELGGRAGWTPVKEKYPDHYDVALDVETGVVVRCLPVGGDADAAWFENDILEVG
ncbi:MULTISPECIES: hypothetical protein [unclassified Nocardioides]|uniref:hypothetical protein n=1 Tax=unclassified Nocardioides TaxID=2615069 RepID=UPI00361856D8